MEDLALNRESIVVGKQNAWIATRRLKRVQTGGYYWSLAWMSVGQKKVLVELKRKGKTIYDKKSTSLKDDEDDDDDYYYYYYMEAVCYVSYYVIGFRVYIS